MSQRSSITIEPRIATSRSWAWLVLAPFVTTGPGCDNAQDPPPADNETTSNETQVPEQSEPPSEDVVDNGPTAAPEGWGNLSGTFIYDGEPPEPSPVDVNRNPQECGVHDLVDEELLVNSETGGIANVVVYLYFKGSESPPEAHPDYVATSEDEVKLDNKNCRFEPHICVLRTSQTLVVDNSDPVGHNTKIDSRSSPTLNPLINPGDSFPCSFPNKESRPVNVSCSIHLWMKAYLFVKDHPYIAVSDEYGRFVIENLPAGTWTFQVWQEKSGYVGGDLQVDGESQDWGQRGQFEITIEEGDNDLGEILVPASVFE